MQIVCSSLNPPQPVSDGLAFLRQFMQTQDETTCFFVKDVTINTERKGRILRSAGFQVFVHKPYIWRCLSQIAPKWSVFHPVLF